MKLKFVELAGFRGFKGTTRFELPEGFVVLTGRNGAGKSTVLDAVEFVLTGTISKYSVRGAKGGGLEEHIWWLGEGTASNHYVTLGLVDEVGEVVITRSRSGGLDYNLEELASKLCTTHTLVPHWPQTLVQTTLIRDETIAALSLDLPEQARFAAVRAAVSGLTGRDYSDRMATILRATVQVKESQERRVFDLRVELGRALTTLTEARSAADRMTDVAGARETVERLAPPMLGPPNERASQFRSYIVDQKQSLLALQTAINNAERLVKERQSAESPAAEAALTAIQTQIDLAHQQHMAAHSTLLEAQRGVVAAKEKDEIASHLLALLSHGERVGLQDGHCPLCRAERTSDQFVSAIEAARALLAEHNSRAVSAVTALENAQVSLAQAEQLLGRAEEQLRAVQVRAARFDAEFLQLRNAFIALNVEVDPLDHVGARAIALKRQDDIARLEHALLILETSGAQERVKTIEARIEQLREQVELESARQIAAERAVSCARQLEGAAKEIANQVLMEQFDTVLPLLKELYLRLRPHTSWEEIGADFGGRVRGSLNLTVGEGKNPQFLFSSGQRRAAGLAFLLAIHLSRPWCLLRTLLLDDPIQHIDDYRALNLVEVLSAVRRTGRQVIVAVEDLALADVLCRRLRSTEMEPGRRFELGIGSDGSAFIEKQSDIFRLANDVLKTG
jgi:chromosome segregation protein